MTSQGGKVGLIRCPNCQKLLPDRFKDHSAYLCGNCDALLTAKRTSIQALSERIDGRMFEIGGISERSSARSEETRFYQNYDSNISHAQLFVVDSVLPNGLQRIEEGDEERYHQMDRFDGIGYRDDERAEILRKLDDLRDQITRTRSVTHKTRDNRMVSHYSFPYMNDPHARNQSYHSNSSHDLPYREHASSSKDLGRVLQQPYYNAPLMYMDRTRVHADSFGSSDLSFRSRDHANNSFPYGHIAYDFDEEIYDHRSVHEVQDSHHSSTKASHSESHSVETSRVLNNGHIRQSIVGGAPFLTCLNCLEVLHLPKKLFLLKKNEKKVKCGVCFMTIMITVETKRLEFLFIDEGDQNYENDEYEGSSKLLSEKSYFAATAKTDPFNEDSDNSSSRLTSRHSTCSSSSDHKLEEAVINENEPNSSSRTILPAIENKPNTTETAITINSTTPPPRGSTLQVYFDYSDKFKVLKHTKKGEGSGLSMHQKPVQNSSETEIDVLSNEFPTAGSSSLDCGDQESKNALIGDKVPQLLENCIEDKIDVTINGNFMPYSLIKRAEKIAGPIYPGHYWYDFRAGFWGVMGGPCLGIIPPFIEEFNFPIPKGCTGGNTGVIVNGRELHEKDLNLLFRRGLPVERDRSYIVEISGRVLDEVTGQELRRLGKLAPTVERSNHGFGMRDPNATT